MRKWAWVATLAALAALPAAAQNAFPDLRGTWNGESESIIADGGNPHHAGSPGREPQLSSIPFTMTIDKQDGRRFSGSFSSPRSTEAVIGVISRNGTILLVDSDGYGVGTLLGPGRWESCYLQIASSGQVASCVELTKQP